MTWDLQTAKKYLGINSSDTSNDEAINLAMAGVMDLVETSLGRPLLFAGPIKETLYNVRPGRLYLGRYPIKEILKIDDDDFEPAGALVDYQGGWIGWYTYNVSVLIEYSGGYETLPPSLEAGLWEIFMMEWGKRDPWSGGPKPAQSAGEISRVTVQDLGSITFDASAAASARPNAKLEFEWGILAPWATILQIYRRGDAGIGLGMA